ncbi:ABC transporter permease [Nocardioides solisilvae]|uniref:ABC transporter permease n=1 Tax=Nocardioides solisilvae TaxID=1542435 RepID=UPI000D746AB9|nr:ABC transporter permease [Nocardioides solisilvae]
MSPETPEQAPAPEEQATGTDPKPEEAQVERADPRNPVSWLPTLVETAVAIAVALVIGALLVVLSDQDALEALAYLFTYPADFFNAAWDAIWSSYSALVRGSVGSGDRLATTLERAAPLICAGLGVSLAFRAGLFNIGATGQMVFGFLAAGYVGFTWDLPPVLHMLVALVAGVVAGALYGGLVGLLKARTGAHEVITTIMFNYLAASILLYALSKDAFQRPGSDNTQSPPVADSATFGSVADVHLGVVLAFLAAGGVWWLLERSTLGFELRAVGSNPDASRTAGMNVSKVFTVGMLLAGALAGLASTMQVLGDQSSLSPTLAGNIGFDAITVALLGRATPLGTVLAGLLFGALSVGGVAMQASAGTPKELAQVLQALIVLFVAAPALVRGLTRMRSSASGSTVQAKGWGG